MQGRRTGGGFKQHVDDLNAEAVSEVVGFY